MLAGELAAYIYKQVHVTGVNILLHMSPNFTFGNSLYINHADRRVNVALHIDAFLVV